MRHGTAWSTGTSSAVQLMTVCAHWWRLMCLPLRGCLLAPDYSSALVSAPRALHYLLQLTWHCIWPMTLTRLYIMHFGDVSLKPPIPCYGKCQSHYLSAQMPLQKCHSSKPIVLPQFPGCLNVDECLLNFANPPVCICHVVFHVAF